MNLFKMLILGWILFSIYGIDHNLNEVKDILNNIDSNIAIISTHTAQLDDIESNTSRIESNTSH
jgi:hypothetical protein